MKVISRPDVSNWEFKHKCSDCESELLVDQNDLKYNSYPGDFREPGYETFSANCAVCGKSFNILVNNIPKLVQLNVKKRMPSRL